MSSSRSDIAAIGILVVGLALAVCLPSGRILAKEATARGRKAEITWLEPDGTKRTVAAREVRYGYFRRVYLSVPRDGLNYKDDRHETKSIPLAVRNIRFSTIDRVDFSREPDPGGGASTLRISVTRANGRVYSGKGQEMPGAHHPKSPYIAFTVDGVEDRIEIHPVGPEEARAGRRRIVSIRIVL